MEKQKLIAFHGKQEIKEKYLNRVIEHRKADNIIKGTYWKNGKGCAVGCTLETNNKDNIHKLMEIKLGIPEELARTEDWLFENLGNGQAELFPEEFLGSIRVGADLSKVCRKFKLEIQRMNLKLQIKQSNKFPELKKIYKEVIQAIKNVIKILEMNYYAAESARSAESAAESAAEYAAESVKSAEYAAESVKSAESAAWSASGSAWSAARSAARSAESAARSAESAESAAWSAAWSAEYAGDATWSATYLKFKKIFIRLLKEAK